MANVWITSDWHRGHKNICNFRKEFSSELEHREFVAKNFKRKVHKRDKTFFLGDMNFTEEALEGFKELPGRKVLILGNHDSDSNKRPSMAQLLEVFDEIHGMYKYKEFWLTHCPMHPDELRGKANIHGHTHNLVIDDNRYLNICLEQTDYEPIDLNEIRKRFLAQGYTRVRDLQKEAEFTGMIIKRGRK
jgi:calcineurin-like phosphoesterase family protein